MNIQRKSLKSLRNHPQPLKTLNRNHPQPCLFTGFRNHRNHAATGLKPGRNHPQPSALGEGATIISRAYGAREWLRYPNPGFWFHLPPATKLRPLQKRRTTRRTRGKHGEVKMAMCFTSRSIAYGLSENEFAELPQRTRKKLIRLMARIAEKSYRRGFQHGGDITGESLCVDPSDLRLSPAFSLDRSPYTDTPYPHGGHTSIERLMMECGELNEIGFRA
jgi:hypothetical protein